MGNMPRLRVLGCFLLLLGAGLVAFEAAAFLAVDACLDAGGSFNYQLALCDFSRSHPVQGSTGVLAAFGLVALVVGGVLVFTRHRSHAP
jgi:hypothetical protein